MSIISLPPSFLHGVMPFLFPYHELSVPTDPGQEKFNTISLHIKNLLWVTFLIFLSERVSINKACVCCRIISNSDELCRYIALKNREKGGRVSTITNY